MTDYSPARVREVITVATSTFDDTEADFPNRGAPIDIIWAAGVNVTSTLERWKDQTIDGTSVAAPHVAGFATYLLGIGPSCLQPKSPSLSVVAKHSMVSSVVSVSAFVLRCMFDLQMLQASPPVAGNAANRFHNNQL